MEKILIKNVNDLFETANRNDINNNIVVEYDENFIKTINFYFKLEGNIITHEDKKVEIKGTATAEMLSIFIELQKTIKNLYAYHKKNKSDCRGNILTPEERKNTSLLFQMHEGSLETILQEINTLLNCIKSMPASVSLPLMASLVIIFGGYLWCYNKKYKFKTKQMESKYELEKEKLRIQQEQFLARNKYDADVIMAFKEVVLSVLSNDRHDIKNMTTTNMDVCEKKVFNKEEIEEMIEEFNDSNNIKSYKEIRDMIVKKLDNTKIKKIAVLINNELPPVLAELRDGLFEEKKEVLINSFMEEKPIKCVLFIDKTDEGIYKKVSLFDILIDDNI